jgi:hypothetical protein
MENGGAGEPPELQPEQESAPRWPRRQVYFVTIEWLDEPHRPESAERLARVIRHTLEHAHQIPPEAPAARFVVRVKHDDVMTEVEGQIEHHHHG